MNWNEDLMSPMRSAIDQAFHIVLDNSCETFKAEAAQIVKNALNNLDNTLKSRQIVLCCVSHTDLACR